MYNVYHLPTNRDCIIYLGMRPIEYNVVLRLITILLHSKPEYNKMIILFLYKNANPLYFS